MQPDNVAREPKLNRRELLAYAWAVLAGLVTLKGFKVLWRIARPSVGEGQFGGIFNLGRIATVPVVNGAPVEVPEGRFWLVRTRDGIIALDKVCTHLDCVLTWDGQSRQFICPCHGSQFAQDGTYRSGPAPRSMDRFVVEITTPTGNIVAATDPSTGKPLALDKFTPLASSATSASQTVSPPALSYLVQVDTGHKIQGTRAG